MSFVEDNELEDNSVDIAEVVPRQPPAHLYPDILQDQTVEVNTASVVAACYFYIVAVITKYQQLRNQEQYALRPYMRMFVALLVPIFTLFGARHPLLRLLQYIYYFFLYLSTYAGVRRRSADTRPPALRPSREVVITVESTSDSDSNEDYQDALEE